MKKTNKFFLFKKIILLLIIFTSLTNCENEDEILLKEDNSFIFDRLLNDAKVEKEIFNKSIQKNSSNPLQKTNSIDASFEAKYGTPLFNKVINLTNENGKPIIVIPLKYDNDKISNLLIGYLDQDITEFRILNETLKNGEVIYVNSNVNEDKCDKTKIGSKLIGGLFKTTSSLSDINPTDQYPSTMDLDGLPDGCYVWDGGDCWCFSSVDCDSIDGGGGSSGGTSGSGSGGTGESGSSGSGYGSGSFSGGTSGSGYGNDGTSGGSGGYYNSGSTGSDSSNCNCGIDPFDNSYEQQIRNCLGVSIPEDSNGNNNTSNPFNYNNWLDNPTTTFGDIKMIATFLDNNDCSQQAQEFVLDFLDITEEIPDAKFERYKELLELIENDPWALIRDCAQQNGMDIANYQMLYDHTLPSECTARLENLGNDFEDQPLSEGNSAVANVDYYGVEITTNPDFDGDNNPDTEEQVYQKYRENFGDLASGGKEDFEFSCNVPLNSSNTGNITWIFSPYFPSDATLWLSSNPLTTIFKIDANSDISGVFTFLEDLSEDDGAIMISAYTSNYWIGSTITTDFSGTQPFSGNRQWGWAINQNGNLELFARAVDVARVSNFTRNNPLAGDVCADDTYYNIGEETWSNLQNEISNWINENGGQSEVVPKTAVRFTKEKIKEILESNETIDQINCN